MLPTKLNWTVNFLVVPIVLGMCSYALLVDERWLRLVITAAIPIAPMLFAGIFIETAGINIAYIGPLMVMFAFGAGIFYIYERIFFKSKEKQ